MKHYIIRKDGVVQSYVFKDEKKFRARYAATNLQRKYKYKLYRVWARKLEPEEEEIEEERYQITTIHYECGLDQRAWHIDVTYITVLGTMSVAMQEAYCKKYVAKAFTKALNKPSEKVLSKNWSVDLGKFVEYPHTQDILDRLGGFKTTSQDDGVAGEEILELWRCRID